MAKYEHLLSVDPIGAFNKIQEDYVRYFETMYRFKNHTAEDSLDAKKNKQLVSNDNLAKEPYVELIPKYLSESFDLGELCKPGGEYETRFGQLTPLPTGFPDFISRGLMGYKPYRHQFEMLCKGYGKKENVLITSGTGSGKTESFMLPLLASLLQEASTWPVQSAGYNPSWWSERDDEGNYVPCQRVSENRPSAIRSLLLYPMNALVADQVSRLRKALDSDDVRLFLDQNCGGNRIFFGSYNGNTLKAKKSITVPEIERLVEQTKLLSDAAKNKKCDKDDIFVSPRLSDSSFTGEMLIREDMHRNAPDVLITNISMLSIMLMRAEEQGMLEQTKNYYETHPEAVFHLVVDELHLHRGTSGAEVAYLLRMFLSRIGIPPMKNGNWNPQLRIYASSASLGANAQQFLADFFGVDDPSHPFTIQDGYAMPVSYPAGLNSLNYNAFSCFYNQNAYGKPYYDLESNDQEALCQYFLKEIGYGGIMESFVEDYAGKIYEDVKNLSKTTFPVSEFKNLPGNPTDDAIRGFLIFRGAFNHQLLPTLRFHLFYRYIDGVWGELLPDSEIESPIGEVMFRPQEVSNNGKHKVLELLRCECCGELFIGGNKDHLDGGRIGLSLNSPQLGIIPNMQATPMVQKKSIDDYALFWPSDGIGIGSERYYSRYPESGAYERFGVVNMSGAKSSENGNDTCHGAWKEGYLNPFDGTVTFAPLPPQISKDNYIHGFLYSPTDLKYSNKPLKALPCKCPACEKDYLARKYTQSPIRSFRTGMGRNNQLFSKELLYQLDRSELHGEKLIGFSDSRQDAAEQSKLIAREHYRDMLRLVFIKLLADKNAAQESRALRIAKRSIIGSLEDGDSISDIITDIDGNRDLAQSERNALKSILLGGGSVDEKKDAVRSYLPVADIVDLNALIAKSPNMIDGEIVAQLLRLGINPAGTEYSDMYPIGEEYWDKYYDFTPGRECMIADKYSLVIGDKTLGQIVHDNIEFNIFSNCFGQYMNVNTEVAGLGYVTSSNIDNSPSVAHLESLLQNYLSCNQLEIQGVIDAFIRIYGDIYRYDGDFEAKPMTDYASFRKPLKKTIEHLAMLSGNDPTTLGNAVCAAMRSVATNDEGKLRLALSSGRSLRFVIKKAQDDYYVCPKCGRVHLHRGMGFCTNTACREKLPTHPFGKVEELWKQNYISFDVKVEPHTPKRLHSEELTGQTDDQTSRLLCFKDIMLSGSEQLTNAIDMLCVTTTMEVGVDIGSLQAIYQGNMPPTRYNYQQRVGRAGRRGQAFSAALTFCRGRSHDIYYYSEATKEITGGVPAVPTISVNPIVGDVYNLVILKRIVLKHVLMLISAYRADWSFETGTVGQLGGVGMENADWNINIRPEIESWIRNNQSVIKDIILYYTEQYTTDSSLLNEVLQWVNKDALPLMDAAIKESTQKDNAQAIAEAGLLPLFGMPTAIRNLYHSCRLEGDDFRKHEVYTGVIDRPLEQAITEFAPGAIKTKDAAEYQSAGLTVSLDYAVRCKNVQDLIANDVELDPLEHSYNLNLNDGEIQSIEPFDVAQLDPDNLTTVRLVIPKAFRTDRLLNNKGNFTQEDDSRSNYTPSEVWVNAASSTPNAIPGGVAMWEVWNGDHKKGDVWYINTNNKEFFLGQRAAMIKKDHVWEPNYYSKKVDGNTLSDVVSHSPNFMFQGPSSAGRDNSPWTVTGNQERIALGAKKVTDILCLSIDITKIPAHINLNTETGNKPAIIAAFYSAATLIQRVFANEIDIDPEEIEISEVKINPTTHIPSVYLNDKAANGAGFISLLCKKDPNTGILKLEEIMKDIASCNPNSGFMKSILKHKACKTSCPKCLNTFYNRGLHHVLDWRLGIDLIKLMVDQNYEMGYTDLKDTPYQDLADLFNELGERVEKANPSGRLKYTPNNGNDWRTGLFTTQNVGLGQTATVVEHLVHPLWNVSDQEAIDGYKAMDSFTLQRKVKPQAKRYQAPTLPPANTTTSSTPAAQPSPSNTGYGSLG